MLDTSVIEPIKTDTLSIEKSGLVVGLMNAMGNDRSVATSARISTNQGSKGIEKDEKLIKYLAKNRHDSPFESIQLQFFIKCPIFIARQVMRHRTASYNEMSLRYTTLPHTHDFYIPSQNRIKEQAKDNKQGSAPTVSPYADKVIDEIKKNCDSARELYDEMCDAGVAREVARMVLPLNTMTQFFMTMNFRNCMHFISLRYDEHAQEEIRFIARSFVGYLKTIAPISTNAFLARMKND